MKRFFARKIRVFAAPIFAEKFFNFPWGARRDILAAAEFFGGKGFFYFGKYSGALRRCGCAKLCAKGALRAARGAGLSHGGSFAHWESFSCGAEFLKRGRVCFAECGRGAGARFAELAELFAILGRLPSGLSEGAARRDSFLPRRKNPQKSRGRRKK